MRKPLYFILLLSTIMLGCISKQKVTIDNRIPGISTTLFKIVDTLEFEKTAFDNDSILNLFFFAEEKNCFLYIFPTFYYNSDNIIGSFKFKDWQVIINSSESVCFMNHIIPEDLPKERIPNTFLKETELGDMIVDPYGMKYLIYEDSIKLVYKGFF